MSKKLIKIDVIIPSYKGYSEIVSFISAIKFQKGIEVVNTVIPITLNEIPSEEDIKLLEFCKSNNIKYFEVPENTFSHSLTRQKAVTDYCESDIVVFLSQDIKLCDKNSFYNLVKDIHNGNCAFAYGKQLGPKRGIERYTREKNYPNKSFYVSKEDIESMQLDAFFASDAFSAIDRNIFLKLNGYQNIDVTVNEDMLYSYVVLMAGYKKKYCADAVVSHYHKLTLKQLRERYYKVGQFFGEVEVFNNYKINDSGYKFAFRVLLKAFKHFDIAAIVRWPFDMATRYFALKKGRRQYGKQ